MYRHNAKLDGSVQKVGKTSNLYKKDIWDTAG
jgi:hypothetical protein